MTVKAYRRYVPTFRPFPVIINLKICPIIKTFHRNPYSKRNKKNVEKNKPSLLPITYPILAELIDTLSLYTCNFFLQTLLKSMFLLCYHACLRVGELTHSNIKDHALKIEKIVIHEASNTQNITITLDSFKHSKSPAVFVLMPSQDRHYCPVVSLLDYLKLRSASLGVLYRLS